MAKIFITGSADGLGSLAAKLLISEGHQVVLHARNEERAKVGSRGERLDESVPGSGLGLAIVRDISKLYAGFLNLERSPLGGLRTRLDLPLIR